MLQRAGIADWVRAANPHVTWHDIGREFAPLASEPKPRIGYAAKVFGALAQGVERAVEAGHFCLTLGGDHSCSIGTWSGAANGLQDQGDLGLVWIDAHMDSHTPDTSPSGNLHGMPIAHLLGRGAPELVALARPFPALKPDCVTLLGGRSYEDAEPALLDELNVRVYWMTEISERGFVPSMREAVSMVRARTPAYGISLDLDGLDPADVSGTGLPVDNGIRADDLIATIRGAARDPNCIGFEIAEFVPALDKDGETVALIRRIIQSIFA